MSSLSSLYLKKETLIQILQAIEREGVPGIEFTVSIGDETNNYGQNLSAYVSQTKEDRESGKKRYYVGNGKCFWTDGTIKTATKTEATQQQQPANNESGLPF